MNKRTLVIVLTFIFLIGLTGCFSSNNLEYLVDTSGFPVGFTRISDGVQIGLGMNRQQVEQKLGIEDHAEWGFYDYDGMGIRFISEIASMFSVYYPNWSITHGISVGDNMQKILDSFEYIEIFDDFGNPITTDSDNEVVGITALNNEENPSVMILFWINEYEEIRSIVLSAVERTAP